MINQISILIENIPGSLADVTGVLASEGVSLKAFSIYDTSDFGILRIIVDQNDKAIKALDEGGFGFTNAPVVAIELDDEPGALNEVLNCLADKDYNINYLYSMVLRSDNTPLIILSIDPCEGVEDYLSSKGFKVYDMEQN